MVKNRQDMQHLDRRRVLKHILKNGLNLIVRCSVFGEDTELSNKFAVQRGHSSQPMIEPFQGNLSKY